ncbi:MAG: O-antigen ligase family protein [Chloroflexi bacterium]|nr:O-antigen ligase family protein [Chloroflexota bacterium]
MSRRRTLVNFLVLAFCAMIVIAASVLAFVQIRDMQTQTRGVAYGVASHIAFGVNVSLEQYSEMDLPRVVKMIRASGATMVRQHFYWNEIEPRKGELDWAKWDRIVARLADMEIVAVLDTSPGWARHPGEADLVNAPPRDVNDYARFVSVFVARYGKQIRYIQIWDNPNVHPFWGRRNADPIEYTDLLRAAATAARAANPNVTILSAGLAPNNELIREHPDYSDVLFLRGIYDAGAKDYFDIGAAKPYGMWSGPDNRRVDMNVFNFSRAILLRDEMVAHGDANKPLWAVEFGWNALPEGWQGAPSPWGSDTEAIQSKRLADAIARAKSEWAWMGAMFVQTFQPNAPADDPQWGFSLVDKNLQARPLYTAVSSAILASTVPASFDFTRFVAMLGGLAIVALIALWQAAVATRKISWGDYWRIVESRFAVLPEAVQFALLALAVIAFYYAPNAILNFVFLAAIFFLFTLRLDLGLAIAVFTIPFYLLPKNLIGGAQFSLVEILVLTSVMALVVRVVLHFKTADRRPPTARSTGWSAVRRLRSFDWAIIFFVLLGILSVAIASNFGVANRELRVVVIEPALLYALIRVGNFSQRDLHRLVNMFILSAVAISLIGLYQFFFTNWVIIGEGVRRVLAVYGSPNNLALYLDRALPLVIALGLFAVRDLSRTRNIIYYSLAAIPIALCLYLTYSRGAWLGIVAGLAVIGLLSGRRVRIAVTAVLVIGAVLVIPFLQTERARSLFQEGTGTGFFRVSVWQSASAMIRDHPIAGVGLDNFLYAYPNYIQPGAWREPNLSHPHNIVLDFWVRLGIGGVMVLGWMMLQFYRKGIKELRELGGTPRALVIGLLASMTAALAHGMIDAAYFYVDLAFVFMLTLGVMMQLDSSTVE